MVLKKKIRDVIKGEMGRFLTNIFDFFLPRICPCCKAKLSSERECICLDCLKKIRPAEDELLRIEYKRDFEPKHYISDFTSAFIFEKDKEIQTLLHELKYNKRFLNGTFLGKQLAELKRDTIAKWNIDFIIPVPLHKLKLAERGYNQSYYISKGLSKKLNIPFKNKIIKRKRFTQSQTNLTRKEREENLDKAFSIISNENSIAGKMILIVDDVITTGATTNECAKALLNAGAKRIYAASAAFTELKEY
jgi:ComF family protein